MGYISDFHSQNKKWTKAMFEGLKEDPERLLMGWDPVSTELWNAILGRDDEPLGSVVGGPTSEQEDELGMTANERKMAGWGKTLASILGLYFGGSALMGGGGTGGTAGNATTFPYNPEAYPVGGESLGNAMTFPYNPEPYTAQATPIDAAGNPIEGGFWSQPDNYRMLANMMNGFQTSSAQPQSSPQLFARRPMGQLTTSDSGQQPNKSDPQIAMANAMIAAEALRALQAQNATQRGLSALGNNYLV